MLCLFLQVKLIFVEAVWGCHVGLSVTIKVPTRPTGCEINTWDPFLFLAVGSLSIDAQTEFRYRREALMIRLELDHDENNDRLLV
jgi:hypothetical protein